MLYPFVRDSSYYQIVRNSGQLLSGYVLDNQFVNILNYINNKLLPAVDNLVGNKISGILDSDGYLLRNIGDGSTQFNRLRGDDIPDGTITLDRFRRVIPNSIVHCRVTNLEALPFTELNTVLSNDLTTCFFGKVKAVNIENNSITNDKIALATLTEVHLDIGLLNYAVNGIVTSKMITDNAITANKIADKAYSEDKFSDALLATRDNLALDFIRDDITGIISDNHIIKKNNIRDNSIPFNNMFGVNVVLDHNNIDLNSIVLQPRADISPYEVFNDLNPLSVAYIQTNSFTPKNQGIAMWGIGKKKLNNAILEKLRIGGLNA